MIGLTPSGLASAILTLTPPTTAYSLDGSYFRFSKGSRVQVPFRTFGHIAQEMAFAGMGRTLFRIIIAARAHTMTESRIEIKLVASAQVLEKRHQSDEVPSRSWLELKVA